MPGKSSSDNPKQGIFLTLSLAVFLVLVIVFSMLSPKAEQYPDYLAISPSPSGVKGFRTFLNGHFEQVSTWQKPVQNLPKIRTNQLMMMVGLSMELSSKETEAWLDWISAGNTLWLLDSDPQGIFDLQTTETSKDDSTGLSEDNLIKSNLTAELKEADQIVSVVGQEEFHGTYLAKVETPERLVPEPEDTILLEDSLGVLSLSRNYGQGKLLVLLNPQWMTNQAILEEDHLNLLLPFILRADPDMIWFNDYIHGSRSLTVMAELYPRWYLIILLQVALAAILWLWARGKRFGPVRIPRAWTVRFGDERIKALASWYERGGFYRESLLIQEEYLYQLIRDKWGIPEKAEEKEYLETAKRKISKTELHSWVDSWVSRKEIKTLPRISPKRYLTWSKRLAFMLKEVEHS